LRFETVSNRILLNVTNRTVNIVVRIEKNVPKTPLPRRVFAVKRMESFGGQLFGRTTFQLIDKRLCCPQMDGKNQMNMIGHNRTGVNFQLRIGNDLTKPFRNSQSLNTRQSNRWKFESVFGSKALLNIVRIVGNTVRRGNLGRQPKLTKPFAVHIIGTGATRVVGQLKTVGAESNVIRNDLSHNVSCFSYLALRGVNHILRLAGRGG